MKVKICGITNLEDALLAEKYGADAIGFIFYKESKRYISPSEAKKIISSLSPFTVKIGVFVNELLDEVNNIASIIKLNAVQLHGDESFDYVVRIKFPVIKSFRVRNGFDFSITEQYKNVPFLLDAFSEAEYGGTGKKFDWAMIPTELRKRIILAGGISPDNIQEIMTVIKPAAIDVSSSLEIKTKDGLLRKDERKIKELFNKIKIYRS